MTKEREKLRNIYINISFYWNKPFLLTLLLLTPEELETSTRQISIGVKYSFSPIPL